MKLGRSSVLALVVFAWSGAAYASPPPPPPHVAPVAAPVTASTSLHPLASAAVEHHDADAAKILGAARPNAARIRAAADDHETVHAEQTKSVRHDIAKSIVLARQDLRKNGTALASAREGHESASATLTTTTEATKAAEAKVAATESSIPWIARKTGLSLSSATRASLAKLADEKSAHETLVTKLGADEQHVVKLAADVKQFETARTSLTQTLSAQKQRAGGWKAEAKASTDAKIAALGAEADKIEADAKVAIHDRVKAWVDGQLASKRNPIAAAHGESDQILGDADRAHGTIQSAQSSVSNASSTIQRRQTDKLLASVTGENAFSQVVSTIDDLSVQSATSDAQSKLGAVNSALSRLGARVNTLKQTVSKLDTGADAKSLSGQVTRVDTDLATLAFVDVALDLAGLESPLTALGLGLLEQNNLSSASSGLHTAATNVNQIREGVRAVHKDLGAALARLDGDAAKIVADAVNHLVAKH